MDYRIQITHRRSPYDQGGGGGCDTAIRGRLASKIGYQQFLRGFVPDTCLYLLYPLKRGIWCSTIKEESLLVVVLTGMRI